MHPALTEQLVSAHQIDLTNAYHHPSFTTTPSPRWRLRRLLGQSQVAETQTK